MLPVFTITFVLGLAFGSYLPYFPFSITALLFGSVGLLTFLESRRLLAPKRSQVVFACLAGGCLYWNLFAWFTPHIPIPDSARVFPVRFEGTIIEAVRHSPARLTALVKVAITDDPAYVVPFHLRLTWRDPDRDLHPGLRIRARGHLHGPSGTLNPRGFDYTAYLEAQGVDAVGSVSGAGAVEVPNSQPARTAQVFSPWIEEWRSRIRSSADVLPQPSRGLFLSLTIGEQGFLAPEVRDWFMTTGTVHILSISGSHLGLIALLSFLLIRRGCLLLPPMWLLCLSRWLTATRLAAFLTLFPVLFYTMLAGAETATLRSAIMITVGLWTVWLGAPRYLLHALAAAAGLTLLVHPAALYDISFQLSYVSVWVLALAVERKGRDEELPELVPPATGRMRFWLWESVRLTALVSLATMPLVACYFNQVSWMGLFANLLVVPFVGFVLLPVSLVSAVWVIVAHSNTLPAGGVIDALGQGLIAATHALAGLPGAEWFVAAPTLPMMLLFYLLGWALLTGRPADSAPLLRGAMVMGLFCIVAWWLWSPRPFNRDGQVRVTFLDVGQGDSAVIELPAGEVILIDGGATYERFDMGRSVVAPFFWNRGIRKIDHVIGTHPQLDHVGGLAWILAHMRVGQFWTNGVRRDEEFWRKIEGALAQHRIPVKVASEGEVIVAGADCRITVLSPRANRGSSPAPKSDSLNNLSVVTELTCGDRRMLFTGDIEREALARLTQSGMLGQVALLKVPHHGAQSSMERDWLNVTKPEIAVVSAGRRNPYGHPVREVLDAYRAVGTQVWRTDLDGAIWADLDLQQSRLTVHRTGDWALQSASWSPAPWTTEWHNIRRLWHRWNWT
ncbi:MAG: putative Competence protein ComEC/Rec2 related protein [Nitrospira sp.]|nr:putative Competence protein ComEC/Rec2 related protein [Nitrospira sp.]